MFLNKKTSSVNGSVEVPKTQPQLRHEQKHAHLVREAWWLGLVLLGLYLAVILFTYNQQDPSWNSQTSNNLIISNAGGSVGAHISDILLSLFGFSAWWWVVLAFYSMWLIYLRLELTVSERPFLVFNLVGFGLLIVASSALEAGHLINFPALLPLGAGAGGVLGIEVDHMLRVFGFPGSTMLLLLLFAIGFSLFTGWSWIMMAEKLGAGLIASYQLAWNRYHDWQDKKAGKIVELKREEFVENERKRTEDRAPLEIKPAQIEIAKSERVLKEKQTTLFVSDQDSSLPPLHLLDEANNTVELPSNETLDFTSRLIERKLADFGIEIKVLSAQPGPVITRFELEPAAGVKGSQITNLARDLARAL